jgi:orotidine-5'-phosphate decarboxylase
VIASGAEPAAIRQKVGQEFLIVTPGIRPAGKSADEHARVTTPSQAIGAGADYLVVGRPITGQADPLAAARRITAELAAAERLRA